MGERGDQYRNVGWPNAITTKYFVVPTNEYYCLDIHYAYQGTCEDIQKSEKTLTILSTTKSVIDGIITAMGIEDLVQATDLYDATADTDAASANSRAYQAKTSNTRIKGAQAAAEAAGGSNP